MWLCGLLQPWLRVGGCYAVAGVRDEATVRRLADPRELQVIGASPTNRRDRPEPRGVEKNPRRSCYGTGGGSFPVRVS